MVYYLCMDVSECVPCCMLRSLRRPDKDVGSAVTQDTGSCELPSIGVGTELDSSRTASCLSAELSTQPPSLFVFDNLNTCICV